jgi:hypothetical protein
MALAVLTIVNRSLFGIEGLQASLSTVEMGATLEDITGNSKKAVRRGWEASYE